MKNIKKNLAKELTDDGNLVFKTTDDDFFKRAKLTANNEQGTKDLLALGMASIWVVFVSIFMKILKPIFKNVAQNKQVTSINTTNANAINQGKK